MLTLERLKQVISYDPDTGIFTWIKTLSNRGSAGTRAGACTRGYRQIRIDGTIYRENRLAWLWCNGYWPKNEIDHINGNPSDNRIVNLREATRSENMQNQRRPNKKGSTGYLGVSVTSNKKNPFRAEIRLNNVGRHLGSFKSAEEAHHAYVQAKRILHPMGTL